MKTKRFSKSVRKHTLFPDSFAILEFILTNSSNSLPPKSNLCKFVKNENDLNRKTKSILISNWKRKTLALLLK